MKDIPKNYKEMIDDDIRACENYSTTSCTYSRSRELFSELIAKYSVRIDGFGDGLSGYSSKSNSYNIDYPDLEELKENITLIKWKLFSFKQNEYQNSGCTERTPEISIKNTLNAQKTKKQTAKGNKVFIVHGHDDEAKITVARTLEQLGLEAIILHEQPDEGNTIIEKLESFTANAAYAIILYTECDIGRTKEKEESANQYRSRQNVVFEHGLFVGCLGRKNVCALVKGDVEKPGDLDGIVYVPMDGAGAWKMQLCSNIKAAGLDIDVNKLI